jgi:hypothetical protein
VSHLVFLNIWETRDLFYRDIERIQRIYQELDLNIWYLAEDQVRSEGQRGRFLHHYSEPCD